MKFWFILFLIILCLSIDTAFSIERRKKIDDDEISYFFYPLAYTVPGIGSGEGAGGTVVNLFGDGSTINLIKIQGDMEVDSIIVTHIPLFTEHFTLSLAYADAQHGGFAFYDRGPDSSEEPDFTLEFDHSYAGGADLTLRFFDRQLEFYSGIAYAFPTIDLERSDFGGALTNLEDRSPEEQEKGIATFIKNFFMYTALVNMIVQRNGIYIDYTDDRTDPRIGVRFQYENWGFEGEGLTNFHVDDYSLTAYIPNSDLSSVLVANVFFSESKVTKPMEFNSDDADEFFELCIEDSDNKGEGISIEAVCRGIARGITDYVETEANNSNSTSLGGPNRLRSYPVSRFHDKYSFFAGLEYRYYFLEHSTPFNFILEKGVFEAAQLALFYEIGQVAPDVDSLFKDFKYSAGVGFRLVFSSVVLRADIATGEEGQETTVFIGYGF